MEKSDVTLVVLSCGRFDLLKLTISSFFDHNDYPIAEILVTEDSGDPAAADRLQDLFSPYPIPMRSFVHEDNHGIISCMDELYQNVKTDLIFHLEDDWICTTTHKDFIKRAKMILMENRKILQVWLRPPYDCNGHPLDDEQLEADGARYRLLQTGFNNIWHGYSNNPNLRRLADYELLGPGGYGGVPLGEMARREIAPNFRVEAAISEFYRQSGFRAAVLVDPDGGFIHAGVSRSVLGYEWSSTPNRLVSEWNALVEERDGLAAEREALWSEREALWSEREALRSEREALWSEREALRSERNGLRSERNGLRSERDALANHGRSLTEERYGLLEEREAMLQSTSWQLTKPLRLLKRLLQKLRFGGSGP
jgi:hypothetical protein